VPGIEKTGTAFAEVSMGRPGPAHLKSPGRATPVASSRQADADSSLRAVSRGYGFSQNTVVIDTRSPDRFARAHIPRSLNVAAFAIKSRADLRGQLLVLVDEGFAPALLLAETVRLRRAGFAQVVVLDGGLAAWIRQGGATEGAESIPMAVMSLPASDFVRTRPDVEWRVLEIGNRNPGVLPLDFAAEVDRPEDLAKALHNFGASASGRQAPRMLVIAPDQATCARIEARLGTTNPAPIYYLTGGRATFDAYRREQVALVQKPHQLIQIRPDRGRSVAAGGCSTCPKSGGR
jgi:rhodanese-related sulfurtransferase